MPTLVLSHRHTPDTQLLWNAAISTGWDVVRSSWSLVPKVEDPVLYGEPLLMYNVADRLGVGLMEPPDGWLAWFHEPGLAKGWKVDPTRMRAFHERFIRRAMVQTKLKSARFRRGPAFVKPAGDKAFPAMVYPNGSALAEATYAWPEDMPILMSKPIRFQTEYRFFMLDHKVVTGSIYMRDGDIAEGDGTWPCDPDEYAAALGFANEIGEYLAPKDGLDGLLPPAVGLDVGVVEEDDGSTHMEMVEINPCWGAGLCNANPDDVLRVIERATVKNLKQGPDARWVKPR
jgi:hypothetical protein